MNIYQWKRQIKFFNDGFQDIKPQQEWDDNTEANLSKLNKANSIWNLKGICSGNKEKAVVIVGASPCLKRDVEKLKQCNENFVIVSVNSALKYLLDHRIKPDYVICLDSDYKDIYQHLDCDSKDLTLIASNTINPKVLDNWKGKVWFTPYMGVNKKYRRRLRYRLGSSIQCGGNSSTYAFVIASLVWNARIVIFVANEFCFPKKNYYCSDKIAKQEKMPVVYPAQTVNGKWRYTMTSLYTYAVWMEKTCEQFKPVFGACYIDTSFGLLGKNTTSIQIIELTEAIKKVDGAFETKDKLRNQETTWDQLQKKWEILDGNSEVRRFNM